MPAEMNVGVEGLPHPPVSEMLRAAGYATAHFGKWNIGKTATAIDTSKNIAAGTYGFDVIDEKGWPNGTAPRRSRLEGRYCVRGVDHTAIALGTAATGATSTSPSRGYTRSPSRPSTWMCGR